MNCIVCCETFNKRNHFKVVCPRPECTFEVCRTCVKTYIEQGLSNPHCMSCRYEYEDEFIIASVTHAYYKKEYKEKTASVLLELEKSLIPSTLEEAKRIIQLGIKQKELTTLYAQLNQISIDIVQKKIDIQHLKNNTTKSNKKFIMRCQQTECAGYLSSGYKCELCDKHTCAHCIEPLTSKTEHVCNEDAVATALLIKNETKPCPKCSQRISKIEGCDQMWCTECNTPFSWKSGLIVNGTVHNPHYFEWLQKQGDTPRTIGDIPCGGIPAFTNVLTCIHVYHNEAYTTAYSKLNKLIQFTTHLYAEEMPRAMNPDEHKHLRIRFILNQIDEDQWKKQLAIRLRAVKKEQHHRQFMEVLFQVTVDILRRGEEQANEIIPKKGNYLPYVKLIDDMHEEYIAIIKYINGLKMKRASILKLGDIMISDQHGYFITRHDGYSFLMNAQNEQHTNLVL